MGYLEMSDKAAVVGRAPEGILEISFIVSFTAFFLCLAWWLRCRKKFFDSCDEYKRVTGKKHHLDFRQ